MICLIRIVSKREKERETETQNQSAKRSDASDWCWLELKCLNKKPSKRTNNLSDREEKKSAAAKINWRITTNWIRSTPNRLETLKTVLACLRRSHKLFDFFLLFNWREHKWKIKQTAEIDETETNRKVHTHARTRAVTQNHRIPQNFFPPLSSNWNAFTFCVLIVLCALIKIENDIKITKDSMTSEPHSFALIPLPYFDSFALDSSSIGERGAFVLELDAVILFTCIWSRATNEMTMKRNSRRWIFGVLFTVTMLISWMRACGRRILCKFRRFFIF